MLISTSPLAAAASPTALFPLLVPDDAPARSVNVCMGMDDDQAAADDSWAELAPRILLLAVAFGYGTNFPAGRLMNDAIPAAAATSGRFTLAALALSPYVRRLRPSLILPSILCGCLDAVGYCSQSVALVDTPAARVSFLGALTVLIIPSITFFFDGRRPTLASLLAALLCLSGVGLLELGGAETVTDAAATAGGLAAGDAWAVLQALGFGASFYLIERMMTDGATSTMDGKDGKSLPMEPSADDDQSLPITATITATVAAFAGLWATCDGFGLGPLQGSASAGWLLDEGSRAAYTLPGVLGTPVGPAIAWTGVVTTALTRIGETRGLARVCATDASVIIATEPLWASVLGVVLLGEVLAPNEIGGGALVMLAPIVGGSDPRNLWRAARRAFGVPVEEEEQQQTSTSDDGM